MSDANDGRPAVVLAEPDLAGWLPPLDRYRVLPLDHPEATDARVLLSGGDRRVDGPLLDRLPAVRLVACFPAGFDHLDLPAIQRRGVVVTHAQRISHEDVADLAIGLLIAAARGIVTGDRTVRAGRWAEERRPARSLTGRALGVVGLGAIGAAVARRAEAMGMRPLWWGPRPKPDARWPRAASLSTLAEASDVLVLACPATPGAPPPITAAILDALGRGGVLVNVARGALVDEAALIAALREGRLAAAGLDVFVTEPTPAERWAEVPNLVLTPHLAGATHEAVAAMGAQCLANADAFFAGEPLPSAVD